MLFDGLMYLAYQPGDELIDMQSIMAGDPLLNTGIKEESNGFVFKSNAFPNPFTDLITLQYSMNEAANVSIEITDIIGKQVMKSNFGKQIEGFHNWEWKSTDNNGNKIPSGVYFYKIKANDFSFEGKIIKQN
jgi:hypothetical protein